jgi:hypothetical protein
MKNWQNFDGHEMGTEVPLIYSGGFE